ncbi:uncharacterized protein LOC103308814 [Acyrthosiphon pisum]|uniref:Reverse transcriptase domain-containing protein n=1 Tax=Acyrthosiphon pisum TaxID=7029 RepID=A0A8R2B4A5_ACYPI|nr:uncharacterized protein LOC103308814 [Acyrthosiphon pisum]|eukprot:XP_008181108.1 PREDICTED: uncharacterized protein LOC103308814 [Acyrthosiphon pisum]
MNINFPQINLQRSSTAQSLASQTAAEIGAQVLLFSEQNWSPARDDRWVVSTDGTCAVVLTPMADFVAETSGSGRGFAWMQTRGVRIYSCYISRNDSDANFSTFLGDVEQSARSADPSCTLILGGDFNAWSQEWGSARNDPRGDQLADLAASLDLLVTNSGTTPTYRRVNSETIIDVTFYRTPDHPPLFEAGRCWTKLSRGWSYRRLDVEALVSHLAEEPLPPNDVTISANEAADSLVNYLASACGSCMPPRAAPPAGRRHVHWWNQDIKLLREDYEKALRKYQRAGRRHDPPGQLELFRLASKAKRKELKKMIRVSQAKSWSDLCAAVDSDPWGLPYRVVTKRIGRHRPGIEARGMETEIADHLFPNPPAADWSHESLPDADEELPAPEFTTTELHEASNRLPPGKATGPDGIPNEVLTSTSTEQISDRQTSTAFDAAGQRNRDLCVTVSLDVRNAFNTAPWRRIDAALCEKKVPSYLIRLIRSYLQDRSILVGRTLLRRSTTCGIPQGSVLGPALWKIFYDELLELKMPQGVQLVAFTDDVCVLGISRNGESASTLMNPVLEAVADWMNINGLQLAPAKTEAIVLTRKNVYNDPELIVEGHAIPVKQSMRYLGVELDTRLLFTKHVQQASSKAFKSALAIARLMPNVGGPSQCKRALLGTVANSKMLYAASTWATQGTKTAKNRNEMARAQRTVAIRTIRAYCTVSADGSSLLASMVPADIVANERARMRRRLDDQDEITPKSGIKKQERSISITAWQARWDRSPNARWTHRLLPDVGRWLSKPPLSLTYHLTQVLSGHGCFRSYLHDKDRAVDSYCYYCMDPDDTVEHTVFTCPRWLR